MRLAARAVLYGTKVSHLSAGIGHETIHDALRLDWTGAQDRMAGRVVVSMQHDPIRHRDEHLAELYPPVAVLRLGNDSAAVSHAAAGLAYLVV